MQSHLYDIFAKSWMSQGGTIWLYSDPHFGDNDMTILRKNNVSDEEQIKRINSVVRKEDTLIILGDLGEKYDLVGRLRGYKVLIKGNHDKGSSNYHNKLCLVGQYEGFADAKAATRRGEIDFVESAIGEELLKGYKRIRLFDEIYEGPLMISNKIILSHEPIPCSYAFNIHGHDHSKWFPEDNLHLNICAEHIDYRPVNLNSLIKKGLLKDVPDIHRAGR